MALHGAGEGVVFLDDDTGTFWQSCELLSVEGWVARLEAVLADREVLGFAFHPLMLNPGGFLRWVLVLTTGDPRIHSTGGPGIYSIWGIYGAGRTIFAVNGRATDSDSLRWQLRSLVNSYPWHGVIERLRDA